MLPFRIWIKYKEKKIMLTLTKVLHSAGNSKLQVKISQRNRTSMKVIKPISICPISFLALRSNCDILTMGGELWAFHIT